MEYINVLVCSMTWVWFQWSQRLHGVLLSDVRVNRSSAQKQCKRYGGLLSFETVYNENVNDTLNENYKQFDDGDSAWVSGLVNYSQFVSWHGCYLEEAVNDGTRVIGKSVSSCSNPCNNTKHLLYIGIFWDQRNGYKCYCISKDGLNGKLFLNTAGVGILHKRDYLGDSFYGNMMLDICDDNLYPLLKVNVFKLYDIKQTPFIKSYGQCVYANKIFSGVTNFRIEYDTRSCFSHGKESKNGYLCVETDTHALKTVSCVNHTLVQNEYCIIHATSDWYQAQLHCISMNGRLVDVIPQELTLQMQTNVTYWTGLFREFKITPSSSELSEEDEADACLSVRRNTTEFVLEPAKCSDVKLKLCRSENISGEILDDHDVGYSPASVKTDNNNKTSKVNDTFELHFNISLTMIGALLLIIVCLITVLYRKTRTTIPVLNKVTFEKGTTTTRSIDSLAADSKYYALETESRDDFHYYSCPDPKATETDSGTSKYDHPHDSGVQQFNPSCLSNTSYQDVGLNVNRNLLQDRIKNESTKALSSNYNMYEEISEQKEQYDAESEV